MTAKEKYIKWNETEKTIPVFSRSWWLNVVCGTEGWDVFLVEDKGAIVGALPYYKRGQGIISMPLYTQTMGPWLCVEDKDMKYTSVLALRQKRLTQLIEQLKDFPHIYMRCSSKLTDWLPFYWQGYQQTTRYTYLLPQLTNTKEIWDGMSVNLRRNIKKAQNKYQLTVQKGVSIENLIRLQESSFERQHHSFEGNKELLSELITVSRQRQQGDIWGAYDTNGVLHAAAFVVWQKQCAYYLAGGSDTKLRHTNAHALVLWQVIQEIASKSESFDFEGSMLSGVERYFREFGALQTPYFQLEKGKLNLFHRILLKLQQNL